MIGEVLGIFETYRKSVMVENHSLTDTLDKVKNQSAKVQEEIEHQLAVQRALQDLHYTGLGKEKEGAMDKQEISRTIYVFKKLKEKYAKAFAEKGGTDAILAALVAELEQRCGNPLAAKEPSHRIYQKTDPKEIRILKTALRALVDDAKDSKWGNYLHPGANKLYGESELLSAREMLAYFVLAAFDEQMPLPPELEAKRAQCIEEEKINVIRNLADIRREHNAPGDNHDEHDEIDEPTCPPGVITRIGNMHVHNMLTSRDDITTPAQHFKNKMQAFLIKQFSELPPLQQFKMINAIYEKIAFELEEESPAIMDFFNSLFMEDKLLLFLFELDVEFNGLDQTHLIMAALNYIEGILIFRKKINVDLFERMVTIANNKLVADIKVTIEDNLSQDVTVQAASTRLASFLREYRALKEALSALQKRTLSSVDDALAESDLANLKVRYTNMMLEQESVFKLIQALAWTQFKEALAPYEKECRKSRGPSAAILSESEAKKLEFVPFWFAKIKCQLEDLEIPFLSEVEKFSFLLRQRREVLQQSTELSILLAKLDCSSVPDLEDKTPTMLSRYEIQKAEHFLMAHTDISNKVSEGNYKPGILVKIERATSDPAVVTFVSPFEDLSKKEYRVPIYILKEYSEKDKNLRQALAHEIDVLLNGFSDLLSLPDPLGEQLRDLFLTQLLHYKSNDPALFEKALGCQKTIDLKGIRHILSSKYPETSPLQLLEDNVTKALNAWSVAYQRTGEKSSQYEWEQKQAEQALIVLEEDVQKIYLQSKKRKSPSC